MPFCDALLLSLIPGKLRTDSKKSEAIYFAIKWESNGDYLLFYQTCRIMIMMFALLQQLKKAELSI